ncbi:hypothetical protein FQN57_004724 [Myotisia sp. PD_48]|nr:hypothetical protein FQN57_004724 [Myotisia sp. PD_48]
MDTKAYLMSQGWSGPGNPLNPSRRPGSHAGLGLTKPILVARKRNMHGIGKKTTHDHTNQWWLRGFEAALRGIGTDGTATPTSSNDECTPFAATSELHRFFVRGQGLAGTIGRREEGGLIQIQSAVVVSRTETDLVSSRKEQKRKREDESQSESESAGARPKISTKRKREEAIDSGGELKKGKRDKKSKAVETDVDPKKDKKKKKKRREGSDKAESCGSSPVSDLQRQNNGQEDKTKDELSEAEKRIKEKKKQKKKHSQETEDETGSKSSKSGSEIEQVSQPEMGKNSTDDKMDKARQKVIRRAEKKARKEQKEERKLKKRKKREKEDGPGS